MAKKLFWIAAGGLSFWVPSILVFGVLFQGTGWLVLNIVALMGLVFVAAASWQLTHQPPRWGWMLLGIYTLGPISMIAPSFFLHAPSSISIPGEKILLVAICLFPPMTLWMAMLNGMIFSVLIVTLGLPLLATHRKQASVRHDCR